VSEADRRKWDDRYASGAYAERAHASALIESWLPELPRGRALDVGCGAGRNAIRLATAGFDVDAVDISTAGLEQGAARARTLGLDVAWIAADLETTPVGNGLPARDYDVIAVMRYVNLPLMRHLVGRLRDGGHLITEQHLRTEREVTGPRNPAFRLEPNALLSAAAGLRVLWYREGLVTDPDGRRAALSQLVACRGPAGFDISGEDLP
jgi:SAM-dependent methyltransferase